MTGNEASAEPTPALPVPTPALPVPTPALPVPTPALPMPTPALPMPTPALPVVTPTLPVVTPATTSGPHATLHRDAMEVLAGWSAPHAGQSALREAFLGFLAARPDATQRSCAAGHLTASALVMSADGRSTLLTLHPRIGRWLQLGGHCEPGDLTLAAAALREATEESGIAGLRLLPDPIHLDVHPVTCSLGVPTRHFDVRFAVMAPADAVAVISDESRDLRFFPVAALPPGADDGLREALALL